ncbi:MAG: hypothetical protein CM15mP75_5330 [Flammeovirgaceae bacterium]|nr:MAG: hypothetical protein CM15mP75_5330 [Flammeovirgaceae bacterium]
MENILIRSHAKCRVGFIHNKLNLFEFLIKSDKEYDIDHRLNKLYSYLKSYKKRWLKTTFYINF